MCVYVYLCVCVCVCMCVCVCLCKWMRVHLNIHKAYDIIAKLQKAYDNTVVSPESALQPQNPSLLICNKCNQLVKVLKK